jgi:hypothetical protein
VVAFGEMGEDMEGEVVITAEFMARTAVVLEVTVG